MHCPSCSLCYHFSDGRYRSLDRHFDSNDGGNFGLRDGGVLFLDDCLLDYPSSRHGGSGFNAPVDDYSFNYPFSQHGGGGLLDDPRFTKILSNFYLAPPCSLKKREVYFAPINLGIDGASVIFLTNHFLIWGLPMRKRMMTLGKTTPMVGSQILEN
jgi:hypothetical protein